MTANNMNYSVKERDSRKLKEEYQKLVDGLRDANIARETDTILVNPVLPNQVLQGTNSVLFFICTILFDRA